MFEVINLLEDSDKEVDISDENDRFMCCAIPRSKTVCKAKQVGDTQLEFIKCIAGNESGLLFALNFDIVKAQIFYH